jgi:alpha-galactosidase
MSQALRATGRAIVFSESAPAYFQGTTDWDTVLGWVGQYGQLWREGYDIAT